MCMDNPVIDAPEGECIQGEVMDLLGIDGDEDKPGKGAKN